MIDQNKIATRISDLFKKKDRNFVVASQIFGALIALISGKLIALYVHPTDFGTYGLQFAAFTLFSSVLIYPAIQFVKANYSKLVPKLGFRPFTIVLISVILIAFCGLMIFFQLYLDTVEMVLWGLLFIYMVFNAMNMLLNDFLNVQNKLILFSKIGMARVTASLVFIGIFFFWHFEFMDHVQALWGMQVAGSLVGILFFYRAYKSYTPKIKVHFKSFLKRYFHFAWPLGFSALWIWISNYFDRYAIEYFLNIQEVGVYSASYSVGSKFFLVISPVFVILSTPIVFGNYKKQEKKKRLKTFGFYYSLIALPTLVLIYIFQETIGFLLLSEDYSDGFFLIFWIALAFFLITLAQLLELYFYSEQRTRVILASNIAAASTNLLLNVLLIPSLGILGAAVATCCGFTAYFICTYLFFNQNEILSPLDE